VQEFTSSSETEEPEEESPGNPDDFEDQRLQKIFNETFADEATLVRETFKAEMAAEEAAKTKGNPQVRSDEKTASLWEVEATRKGQRGSTHSAGSAELWEGRESRPAPPLPTEESLEQTLQTQDLDEMVDRVLERIVPPIVERLVQERLDKLLKEQEQFLELKP
jgi:hypothetical protein